MEIRGKVAIVTGASSGIGEATAREFGREGAKVVIAARRLRLVHRVPGPHFQQVGFRGRLVLGTLVHDGSPVRRCRAALKGRPTFHPAPPYRSGAKYPGRLWMTMPADRVLISTFLHFPSRVELVDV